jgi:RNA polymerase sigma factor (sigma-70 family)
MARGQVGAALGHLRQLIGAGRSGEATDRQLLECFAAGDGEAAFAELVRRHGPLVLGVCRRVLHHLQDAEDAFQATFLVLARKAGAVRWEPSVARWLYEVAYRVARKAQLSAARRSARERHPIDMVPSEPAAEAVRSELRLLLDEEVNRLPRKYRSPVVLCYLEGKTNQEAAHELGWTKGTVSGRLARARDLLRARLTRRGLALSAAALAPALAEGGAAPAVPAALAAATVRAAAGAAVGVSPPAAALAADVLRDLARTRLQFLALALLAVVVAAAGALAVGERVRDRQTDHRPPRAERRNPGRQPQVRRPRHPGYAWVPARTLTREDLDSAALALAFAPGGQTLATAHADGTIKLWNAATGRRRTGLKGHPGQVVALAFAPDGKTLASVCDAGALKLWDVARRRARFTAAVPRSECWSLAFAPDGKTLAAGSCAGPEVRLWDATTGQKQGTFAFNRGQVVALAFASDGQTVTSASLNDVRAWSPATRRVVHAFPQPPVANPADFDTVRTVSPDGSVVATFAGNPNLPHAVKLWDFGTGQRVATLRARDPEEALVSVALAPDGKTVATVTEDGTLRVWDAATGKERARLAGGGRHPGPIPVAFAAGGRLLATGMWRVKLYRVVPRGGLTH